MGSSTGRYRGLCRSCSIHLSGVGHETMPLCFFGFTRIKRLVCYSFGLTQNLNGLRGITCEVCGRERSVMARECNGFGVQRRSECCHGSYKKIIGEGLGSKMWIIKSVPGRDPTRGDFSFWTLENVTGRGPSRGNFTPGLSIILRPCE